MRRENKKRNKIIIGLISLLLLMTVGYAAFQTNLNIKGTSKISSNWDIRITNVTSGTSTGNAENVKTPTWTNLTASMEANLYEKGDAMEYEVTVENKGTFDAKLESISSNESNNEAIKISFSGYTKGEKLYKNSTQTIKVKIEYNKDFNGTPTSNSNEVSIDLNYGQAEGGTIEPTTDYLLTYDYRTNGGEGTSETAYLSSNESVDLSKKGKKEGYTFVGWNTDKNAKEGLSVLNMPSEDTVLYAIYKKELKVTYSKGEGVTGIGKTEDSCNIYNNETECEITLPSITVSTGYNIDGWYNGSTKAGNQNAKININTNTSLVAKAIDNIAPTTPTIRSSYNIWGSKEYVLPPYLGGGYEKNAGIDGVWKVVGTDPAISFKDISSIKNIDGAYVELDAPLNVDLGIYVFYSENGESYTSENAVYHILKAGNTRLVLDLPKGNYKSVRYDIGDSNATGLSYKIRELGLIADEGQWNDNSIRTIMSSTDEGSGIERYEWYTNGTWTSDGITIDNGVVTTNFTENQNSTYKYRVVDKVTNVSEEKEVNIKIDKTKPIIDNVSTTSTTNSITVIASAHDDESGISKYEYSLDGINWIKDTDNHTFTDLPENNGYIIKVKVTNNAGLSETYTYESQTINNLKNNILTEGDGLYKDETTINRYIYRGENPNNYITFNNEEWRIIAIENDGALKIMKDTSIGKMPYDKRTSETSGPRLNSNNTYCSAFPSTGYYYGCNAWNSVSGQYINGDKTGTVTENASLNSYLNNNYYNSLSANSKKYIKKHDFNAGGILSPSSTNPATFTDVQNSEKSIIWNGKIGLPNISDYLKASTSSECNTFYDARTGKCYSNNYFYKKIKYWFLNAWENSYADVWHLSNNGYPGGTGIDGTSVLLQYASLDIEVLPVLYIDSNISGDGAQANPYINGIKTEKLDAPIFNEITVENGKDITITFPKNCNDGITCSYQKDNEQWQTVTSESKTISFDKSGTLVAKVSDSTTEKISSYVIQINTNLGSLDVRVASSGDGLYADTYEKGRYVYKGDDPNNHITFNNEPWRILSIEKDGTIKIIKQDFQGTKAFDSRGNRDNASNNTGGTYCELSEYGCNAWAKTENHQSGGTVLKEATLNTYLNNDYYNILDEKSKSVIESHTYNIGNAQNVSTVAEYVKKEKEVTWQGKIGLMNISDWFRASNNSECTSNSTEWCPTSDPNHDNYKCSWNNFLYKDNQEWTMTPASANGSRYTMMVGSKGCIGIGSSAVEKVNYRPALFLKNTINLSGTGTEGNPYTIN